MTQFKYRIVVGWSEEDDAFVARVPALDGCVAHGDTEAEAAVAARSAGESMLSVLREHGNRVPPVDASVSAFSGNLRLRIPRSLHARLDALAAAEGVSLNQLMVALLAGGAAESALQRAANSQTERGVIGVAEAPLGRKSKARTPAPRTADVNYQKSQRPKPKR